MYGAHKGEELLLSPHTLLPPTALRAYAIYYIISQYIISYHLYII